VAPAAVLLSLALAASACGGGSSSSSTDKANDKLADALNKSNPDTLVDYQNFGQGPVDHIDPTQASTLQGSQIPVLLYEGLTTSDKDGKVEPLVAEKWDVNSEATEFTFHLRKSTFSTGEEVLPSTFKKSWERALAPELAGAVAYHLFPIKGAQDINSGKSKELTGVVADDKAMTLKVTLDSPFADFPQVVQHAVFSPMPKEALSVPAAQFKNWDQGVMIGNGPFKMQGKWVADEGVTLVKNDKYDGKTPAKIDTIKFVVSKDLDSAYSSFQSGKADTAYIPAGKFARATKAYPNNITNPYLGVYKFELGQDNPNLGGEKNVKLRQAISMAIDRERINNQVYNGARKIATGLTPPGVSGYKADLCKYCKYDPTEAKKLFKEWQDAGGSISSPLLISSNSGAGHEPVVQIMSENLKAIGIPSKFKPLNPDTWTDDQKKPGGCQICRSAWVWDYPIYDNDLSAQYLSTGIGSDNWARYNNPKFDQMIKDARAETDQSKRNQLYQDAESLLLDEAIVMPLNWYTAQVVMTSRVKGLEMKPLGYLTYTAASLDKG